MPDATPLQRAHFREVLGHFASGLTIITGMSQQGPQGFTCQAFSSLSLDPQLVVFAVAKTSTSWPKIRASGTCCINILESAQEALARQFAESDRDKFAAVGWHAGTTAAPRLESSLAWIDCNIATVADAGDHELVTAAVVDLAVGSGSPLLFYRGGFGGFEA